jgi:hypothetical protein
MCRIQGVKYDPNPTQDSGESYLGINDGRALRIHLNPTH